MQALERSAHAVHSLHYHLVLVTNHRKKCLAPEMLPTGSREAVASMVTASAAEEGAGGRHS